MGSHSQLRVLGVASFVLITAACGKVAVDEFGAPADFHFKANAAQVFQGRRLAEGSRGFRVAALDAPAGTVGAPLVPEFPGSSNEPVVLALSGGMRVEIRERSLTGSGMLLPTAAAYARGGGTSYWGAKEDGVEEWLDLEAARPGVVAEWDIAGATLKQSGAQVLVLDKHGTPRLRVAAPAAFSAEGAKVKVALSVDGQTLRLSSDTAGHLLIDPSWTLVAGMMATGRYGHTATLLQNGKVLVAGGFDGTSTLAACELYDPATGLWTAAGSMATSRTRHTASMHLDGKVYVSGGANLAGTSWSVLASVEVYDPSTNSWATSATPLRGGRAAHSQTMFVDGGILTVGGEVNNLNAAQIGTFTEYPFVPCVMAPCPTFPNPYPYNWHFTQSAIDPIVVSGGLSLTHAFNGAAHLRDDRTIIQYGDHDPSQYYGHFGYLVISPTAVDGPATAWYGNLDGPPTWQSTLTALPDGGALVAGGFARNYDYSTYVSGSTHWFTAVALWQSYWGAAMQVGRARHSATLLPDGRVLVAGGVHTDGTVDQTSELLAPGQWGAQFSTMGPPLADERQAHTQTLLPGGDLLIIGGLRADAGAVGSSEILSFGTPTWTAEGWLVTSRTGAGVVGLANGMVLTAGGSNAGTPLSSAELFDPGDHGWHATAALAAPRAGPAVAMLPSGQVLVAGGTTTGGVALASAEVYEWSGLAFTGSWFTTGSLAAARPTPSAVVLADGRVLLVGLLAGGAAATPEVYTPGTRTWSLTSPMVVARNRPTLTLLNNGKVLATGGTSASGSPVELASAELFDPAGSTWTAVPPMSSPRAAHAASILGNGSVVVTGGVNAGATLGTGELFDPGSNTWSPAFALTNPRQGHSATALFGGQVLLAGGKNNSGIVTAADVYDPQVGGCLGAGTVTFSRTGHSAVMLSSGRVLLVGGVDNGGGEVGAASLFDEGRGAQPEWTTSINTTATVPFPMLAMQTSTDPLNLTGALFRGVSEASSGTAAASPTNYPLLQVRSMPRGLQSWVKVNSWSDTQLSGTLTNLLPSNTAAPNGWYWVRVVVNGVPSAGVALPVFPILGMNTPPTSIAPRDTVTITGTGSAGSGYHYVLTTNNSGGSINLNTGAYTAGPTAGAVDVVRVDDGLGHFSTSPLNVGPGVSVTPASKSLAPKVSQTFVASGGKSGVYTFAFVSNLSGGSLVGGAYTAGANGSVTDVLSATDSVGNSALVNISVGAGVSVTPSAVTVFPLGSMNFVAGGGTATGFTWAFASGGNHSGGSINPSTGVYLAGSTGGVDDTIQVTDSVTNVGTAVIHVGGGVSASPSGAFVPPRGSLTFSASGGSGSGYTWAFAAGGKVSNGTIGAATGAYVAGTSGGTSAVIDTVEVTDSLGGKAQATVNVRPGIVVTASAPTVTPKGHLTFTAAGGTGGPYTFSPSVAPGTTSGGTVVAATGSYTAGAAGGVTDTITATDTLGNFGTASVTVSVGVSISPNAPSVVPQGTQAFTASGGVGAPWVWSIKTNASAGFINPSTGAYTAGPNGAAAVQDVIQAVDSIGNVATTTVTVLPGVTLNAASPSAVPRESVGITATGGAGAPYTWMLNPNASGGALKNGLASCTTASCTYTAGLNGGVIDTVQVSDNLGNLATVNVNVLPGVTLAPSVASVAPRGAQAFTASGGKAGGYVWGFVAGANRSGGTLSPTGGYLAGSTASVVDSIQATDSLGNVGTAVINVGPALAVAGPTTAIPRQAKALSATGGSGTVASWSVSTNNSGASIDGGFYIAGPTGGVTDTLTAYDTLGNTGMGNVAVSAGVSVSPATPNLAPKQSQTFVASGGLGSGFQWFVTTNNSGGTVGVTTGIYKAGTNGGAVAVTDVVEARDTLGNLGQATVLVTEGVTLSPANATVAPRGTQVFVPAGGSGAGFQWNVTPNLSNATVDGGVYVAGVLGSKLDTVNVTDSLGNTASANVNVTAGVVISPGVAATPPRGTVSFSASGGSNGGFAWSIKTNGSGGATIDPVTGTYQAGNAQANDVAQVTDSLGNVATVTITVTNALTITPNVVTLSPQQTRTFSASGGADGGYFWALTAAPSGAQPLVLGPPVSYTAGPTGSADGGVVDVIQVTDTLGATATARVTIGPGVTVAPASANLAPRETQIFTGSGGGGAPYAWTMASAGSGGTVDAGIYVAGATGGTTDVVQAADVFGNTATVTVTVKPGVTVDPESLAPRSTKVLTPHGGTGFGFKWKLETNNSGATLNTATGSYTAGSTPNVEDTVSATDSLNNVGLGTITVTSGLAVAAKTVAPRGQVQLTASGGGATAAAGNGCSWSVVTNNSGGSLNPATGAYTAGPVGSVVDTVKAIDALGSQATADVAVSAGVTVVPEVLSVEPNGTRTLNAIGGNGSPYTWSFEVRASGAADGGIDPSGNYHAGPTGGVVDVVLATDSLGNYGRCTIAVTRAVSIAPQEVYLDPGSSQQFTASFGTPQADGGYTWALSKNNSNAHMDPSTPGLYVAGALAGVDDTVMVTDRFNGSDVALVHVVGTITVDPAAPAAVHPGDTIGFTATGGWGAPYSWTVTGNSGATVEGGIYVAGPNVGLDTVEVTDKKGLNAKRVPVQVVAVDSQGGPVTDFNSSKPVSGWSCGCQSTSGSGAEWLGLAGLALVALRRRRARGVAVVAAVSLALALNASPGAAEGATKVTVKTRKKPASVEGTTTVKVKSRKKPPVTPEEDAGAGENAEGKTTVKVKSRRPPEEPVTPAEGEAASPAATPTPPIPKPEPSPTAAHTTTPAAPPTTPATAAAPRPAPHQKTSLAVMDVEVSAVGEKLDSTSFTEMVVTAVDGSGYFKVISAKEMATMLGIERQKALLGCTDDTSCMAEFASALGADLLLVANVGKVGDSYLVAVKLIDGLKSRVIARGSVQSKSANRLLDAVWKATHQVLDSYGATLQDEAATRWAARTKPELPAALVEQEAGPRSSLGVEVLAVGAYQAMSNPGLRGSVGGQVDLTWRLSRFDLAAGVVIAPKPGARLTLGFAIVASEDSPFRLGIHLRGTAYPGQTPFLIGGGLGLNAEYALSKVFAVVASGAGEAYAPGGKPLIVALGGLGVAAHF